MNVTPDRPPLPAFDEPPVRETLLGVQFAPLQSFSPAHAGVFWTKIRTDYPQTETKAALGPVVEDFGEKVLLPPQVGIQLVTEPDVRFWFIDPSSTQLIQVQKDRFIRNWRRVKSGDVYPHYDTLKPKFAHDWESFCEFLEDERLGVPEINQCEVTYINHIGRGVGSWDQFGEAYKVLTVLTPNEARAFLPAPEIVQLNYRYPMGEKQGRLHVMLQPAIRREDAEEVLQLTLTARGRPASSAPADVLAWFDMGHEWIVRGFADLTTSSMHNVWRRRHDHSS